MTPHRHMLPYCNVVMVEGVIIINNVLNDTVLMTRHLNSMTRKIIQLIKIW